MVEDRRECPRANAFTFGHVRLAGAAGSIECLVWDLSEIGARIEVEVPDALPQHFGLAVGPDAPLRPVRVVRRDGRRLGIVFARDPA